MFDNFEKARRGRKARWVYGVLAGVVGVHGVLLLGLLAKSWWHVDKLSLPHEGVALAVAPPPPAPPPARKGSPEVSERADAEKKARRVTDDTTQPVRLSEPVAADDGGGEQRGVADGEDWGDPDSDCVGIGCDPNGIGEVKVPESDPCEGDDPPARCKKDDPIVPQVAVDKQRIAGNDQIHPDGETKLEMVRDRRAQVVITVKMCINDSGNVRSLKLLESSGYAAYDARVLREMRQWRYTPFEVNGEPTPVCTAITILYRMR